MEEKQKDEEKTIDLKLTYDELDFIVLSFRADVKGLKDYLGEIRYSELFDGLSKKFAIEKCKLLLKLMKKDINSIDIEKMANYLESHYNLIDMSFDTLDILCYFLSDFDINKIY